MKNKYIKFEKLEKGITCITNITEEKMYLIEGEKKAALIDTGVGYGDLDIFIKELTSLPIVVLLTHGHMDHAGGCGYFDEAYIHASDLELAKKSLNLDIKREFFKMICPDVYADLEDRELAPVQKLKWNYIAQGDVIDLGNRFLHVVETPGHTLGSVCFWEKDSRILFTGDACNKRTFLFSEEASTLVEYMSTLKKMGSIATSVEHIYNSHDEGEIPRECIYNVLSCCIDILNYQSDEIPFYFMGELGYQAKATKGMFNRADGVYGNIIYNKNKMYRE